MILVSPTEPPTLRAMGETSLDPETYGVDVLVTERLMPAGLDDGGLGEEGVMRIGIQRKEVQDLVASLTDGRLSEQTGRAKYLDHRILLIEGALVFNRDGVRAASWGQSVTKSQIRRLFLTAQLSGWWMMTSDDLSETTSVVADVAAWARKGDHRSLATRGKAPKGAWGLRDDKDWATWVLMGFEGLGQTRARAIVDEYGGLPLKWTVSSAKWFEQVPGIGRILSERLWKALRD